MAQATITFETVSIETLKPYAGNARHHPKAQIKRLAARLLDVGVANPPLIDENSVIIAGHGRLLAAASIGMTSIPVIRVLGLTEAQTKALRISDNRLAEKSTWSPELLKLELESLIELDVDMQSTGFDDIEIEKLLTLDADDADEEPDIPPPPVRPVTRVGDLWAVGKHLILCGDARDPVAYDRLLEGAKADQVITDIPFNVPVDGHISGQGRHAEFAMASGEMTPEQFAVFVRTVMTLARDASRAGSLHYWFIDWRSVAELIGVGREVYGELKNLIVWAKPNAGLGTTYRSQHELIPVFKHGSAPHKNNIQLGKLGRNRSNLWQYPGGSGFSKTRTKDLADHPTIKNTRMIADAIRDASNPNDLILDPFAGSGTINLAAEQVGRHAASIEIEPRFVDVALSRYQALTGEEAVLMPDRQSFSSVKHHRAVEGADC